MTDLNLLYSGGSGGFILLHILLLSDKFHSEFKTDLALDQIIEKQWEVIDHTQWKTTEFPPDNFKTLDSSTDKNKIYYFCNPSDDTKEEFNYGNFKLKSNCNCNLVLYTDFASQKKLAFYKQAHWYIAMRKIGKFGQDLRYMQLREHMQGWRKHYNNIKDPTWPTRPPIKKLKDLPPHILKEILETSGTELYLNIPPIKWYGVEYQGSIVVNVMIDFLRKANYVVKLQDLINSQAQVLVDLNLIDQVNDKQIQLINRWKQLHPTDLLREIGIH